MEVNKKLDDKNLASKIKQTSVWLQWYQNYLNKLNYFENRMLYMQYLEQSIALEKVLEALKVIQKNSKILLGE